MKKLGVASVFAVTIFIIIGSCYAVDVKIFSPSTNKDYKESVFVSISLEMMQHHAVSFKATDPNFKTDGRVSFTGISIKRLFSLAGQPLQDGVTLIARDQYVGFIPSDKLGKMAPHLVWQLNGQPISKLKGGPLKIVYPDDSGVHGPCYVWYVDTLISGRMQPFSFQWSYKGKVNWFNIEDTRINVETLDHELFSIPAGCKADMRNNGILGQVKAISMKDLIGPVIFENANRVTLVPFSGMPIKLSKAALQYPIYITVSSGGKPLHPAFGGPFSVIFPVEQYPKLFTIVPESGALFFLQQIRVE
ncbi:MAG: hypothetical protein L3J69_02205 [Desulfobacula sp.]|nr:hypothetical protein [Desulfobacula sp.]